MGQSHAMEFAQRYIENFTTHLQKYSFVQEPNNLYEPIEYIMHLGGKRVRPALVLMGYDAFCDEGDLDKVFNAALAVEVFHNFTLVHDDIMDEAPLRRGKETVHTKYDINTGILSGDAMLIKSYMLLNSYPSDKVAQILPVFSTMAIKVCEGQQMDMDFEEEQHVEIPHYIEMIRKKTSELIAAALEIGAILGGASKEDAEHIYGYGINSGIAFQIQDDILDTYGEAKVGKQAAGDIIQNKKTYLYLKALELGSAEELETLRHWYSITPDDPQQKIKEVKAIFDNTHVVLHAEELMKVYSELAFSHLDALTLDDAKKQEFRDFTNYFLSREV